MTQWVIASSNAGKLKEFNSLLTPLSIDLVTQQSLDITAADETGLTFLENALIKARHASKASGLPALADDSGLCVNALDGAPGIYTARYAGVGASNTDNINKLLLAMKDIPKDKRQAHFYCVLVLMQHEKDPAPLVSIGQWSGEILFEPEGHLGFGYDPIFYCPKQKSASACLEPDIKNQISHRAQALNQLITQLKTRNVLCTTS
jgi:XTP/dITP diphosphohydrolase